MSQEYLLEMRGIVKEFPGVKALQDVDFQVRRGEVHALMGENGAGKSTLIKILTGIHQRDAGEILFDGHPINPEKASEAQHLGISTIYQELNLIPYLSVCENIFIGREPKKFGLIDWRKIETRARDILLAMGVTDIDVKARLNEQSVAIQQMVAIARAISIDAKLLVMDEPTSSLDKNEVGVLFGVIRKLQQQSISVIFISHTIDEVFEISNSVSVLKDGQMVDRYPIANLDKLKLISAMIGCDAAKIMQSKKNYADDPQVGETICEARKINKGLKTKDIDLEMRRGEILGLAGLLGSGRTEFAKLLFGDVIPDSGEFKVNGKPVVFRQPRDAIAAGLAYCSEDRKSEGIVPYMSVADNITLVILKDLKKAGIISKQAQREVAETYIRKLDIRTSGPDQLVRNLSGGNQQKVLLARWLCKHPMLIILDEPTRGIDVGAKSEIETLVQDLASDGISVLIISSELEELIRGCDRIAVLRDGEKVGELTGSNISEKAIMGKIAADDASQDTPA